MKHLAVYGLLIFMLVLAACPMQTDEPIDNGSYAVPSWILGSWTVQDRNGGKGDKYFMENSSKKGQLKCYSVDSVGKKTLSYDPVIMSAVGDKVYISAFSEAGYYLFEFRKVNEREFILAELKEKLFMISLPSKEIKKFLVSSQDDEITLGVMRFKKD